MKTVLLVVLGLTGAAATRLRVGMAAEASATAWLREHAEPQADELAELRDANPEAYAIVTALLTKRSLGLLDPKHPTASFANAPKAADDATPHGAAAYQALMTPKDEEIEARSASAAESPEEPAVPEHHIVDMFAWKPSSSASNDDAEVQSVLGAVANLKQSAPAAPAAQADSPGGSLAADANLLDGEATAPAAPVAPAAARSSQAPPAAPVQESAPEPQVNEAPAPPQPAPEENHYLKGLDLSTAPSKGADLGADMKMFEDTSSSDNAAPTQATAAPVATTPAKPDALSSWLGVTEVVKKAPVIKKAASAAPSNPYMVDWNN